MSLISSLGLDDVPADPNDIPPSRYDGEVIKSEFVLQENKDSVSHAITYRVTEGEFAGAQKQQWYTLYTEVRDENGNFPTDVSQIKAAKPALTDTQKRYYKKLFVDVLGIPEEEVSSKNPEDLVGRKVTFGVALKNGYKNISFVEGREDAQAAPVAVDPFGQNQF